MGLSPAGDRRPLSDSPPPADGHGCLVLFGAVFAAFGSIFVALFLVLPLWHALAAATWVSVPCTLLESRLGTSTDSDGSTYRVEVRYEYHFRAGDLESDPGAPRYESTRYDFSDGIFSSGRADKLREVERLAAGTRSICRVDPAHPDQAVLVAGTPGIVWLGSLTLIFPLIGLALMGMGMRRRRRARQQREGLPWSTPADTAGSLDAAAAAGAAAAATATSDADGDPLELRPSRSRVAQVVFITLFALFWNGLSWTALLAGVLPDLMRGDWSAWFALLFLSLFLFIGVGLIGAVLHQLLALSNPRLRLTVGRRAGRAGETLALEWECAGNPARITTLTIALEGRESATYTRGTDTTTDTHVFARLPLATLADPAAILNGRARLILPADAVPTFIATRNRIEWFLTVRGSIPRWPDISDDYPFTVLPARNAP